MPAQNFVLHVYSSLKQILGRIERHSVVKHPLTDTGYRTGSGGTEKSDNTRSKSHAKPGFSGIEIKLEQVRYIPVYSRAARELYCTNVHIYSIGKIKWSLTVAVPIFDDSDLLDDLFVIVWQRPCGGHVQTSRNFSTIFFTTYSLRPERQAMMKNRPCVPFDPQVQGPIVLLK